MESWAVTVTPLSGSSWLVVVAAAAFVAASSVHSRALYLASTRALANMVDRLWTWQQRGYWTLFESGDAQALGEWAEQKHVVPLNSGSSL